MNHGDVTVNGAILLGLFAAAVIVLYAYGARRDR